MSLTPPDDDDPLSPEEFQGFRRSALALGDCVGARNGNPSNPWTIIPYSLVSSVKTTTTSDDPVGDSGGLEAVSEVLSSGSSGGAVERRDLPNFVVVMKLEGVVQVVAPVNLWDAEYQNHVVHDAGVLLTAESKVALLCEQRENAATAEGEGEVFRRISEYGGFLVGLSLVAVGVRRDAQGIMDDKFSRASRRRTLSFESATEVADVATSLIARGGVE